MIDFDNKYLNLYANVFHFCQLSILRVTYGKGLLIYYIYQELLSLGVMDIYIYIYELQIIYSYDINKYFLYITVSIYINNSSKSTLLDMTWYVY